MNRERPSRRDFFRSGLAGLAAAAVTAEPTIAQTEQETSELDTQCTAAAKYEVNKLTILSALACGLSGFAYGLTQAERVTSRREFLGFSVGFSTEYDRNLDFFAPTKYGVVGLLVGGIMGNRFGIMIFSRWREDCKKTR